MYAKMFESFKQSVVSIDVSIHEKEGNGSGIVVNKEGTVLTCEHVVRPNGLRPDTITIRKDDEVYSEPEIVKLDRNRDIALLKVRRLHGTCSFKGYDEVTVGDRCIVLGYPLRIGHLTLLEATISAKGEHLISGFPYKLIQIDSRVNVGNSGGPVIDVDSGRVIGIVSLKYIPFLSSVKDLQKFYREIPKAPTGTLRFTGVDWGVFFNISKESFRRLADALMLVQVGIGWVIPSDLFLRYLE